MAKYIATFHDSYNGYFIVNCEGLLKSEKRNNMFPTLVEAIEECGGNAAFINAAEVNKHLEFTFRREMTEMTKTKLNIISMMKENPVAINNHDGKEKAITGLVEFNNPNKPLACCFDARYYSLNECYIGRDEKLHCSQYSVGGNLWGAYPDAEQLKKYNESCIFDSGKIKCIHRPDGTIVYPAN